MLIETAYAIATNPKHLLTYWCQHHLSYHSLKMHEQRKTKQKNDDKTPEGAVPAYLLDREGQSRAKILSNMIKQKRKEKAVSIQCLSFICLCFRHHVPLKTGNSVWPYDLI